jgi:hypothetical protein
MQAFGKTWGRQNLFGYGPIMTRKILFVVSGTGLGIALVHFSTLIIGRLFGPLYASEQDMQRNLCIYLAAIALMAIVGGWLGNRLASKNNNL